MAWLDVEAFDCCMCLYACIASAVCDFLDIGGMTEVDEPRACFSTSVVEGNNRVWKSDNRQLSCPMSSGLQ